MAKLWDYYGIMVLVLGKTPWYLMGEKKTKTNNKLNSTGERLISKTSRQFFQQLLEAIQAVTFLFPNVGGHVYTL